MIKKTLLLSLLASFIGLSSQTTATYTASDNDFKDANELYYFKTYQFAQDKFQTISINKNKSEEIREISNLYVALCAIKLGQKGALERYEAIVNKNTAKEYILESYQDLGDYFYQTGDYQKALQYYEKSQARLVKSGHDAYEFRYGYAAFNQKEYDKAANAFSQIGPTSSLYEDGQYFMGHIAFVKGENEKAKTIFEKLANSEKYKEKVSPYLLQTAYKTADYETAIEEGKKIIATDSPEANTAEAQKLVGESLFKNKQYAQAIPYLEKYNNTATSLKPTDYYQLGFAYYQTEQYQKAVDNYNKIIGGNDAIAQTAYYQLGHSYLKINQKQEALNALKQPASINFDPKVKKDALYNYAKLSYEIGNSSESTQEALNSYLVAYPKDEKATEIYTLLGSSYANLDDYSKAYKTLKAKLIDQNPSLKNLQANIGLKYAGQLYREGNYIEAEKLFAEVAETDVKMAPMANYWKAQCEYQAGNYKQALVIYNQVESQGQFADSEMVAYNKGYCFYKLKDYKNAAVSFGKFVQATTKKNYKEDAQLRLADSYYASSQYSNAQEEYQKVIDNNQPQKEYAAFQIAMLYGLTNKNEQKLTSLQNFIKTYQTADYQDDANFQLADTYFKLGNNAQALTAFDAFQQKFPTSEFVALAELKKAQIYYNQNQLDQALASYKKVSQEANTVALKQEAAAGVKKVYTDQANISGYQSWTQSNNIQTDTDEITRLAFEVAEKQFEEKNYEKAIVLFTEFNTKYPNSVNTAQANYYIAESYYQINKFTEAKKYFEKTKTTQALKEQSYLRLTQLYAKENNTNKILENLLGLEQNTHDKAYKNYASTGLMRIYMDQNNLVAAKPYAETVLADKQSKPEAVEEAKLVLARSIASTDTATAQQYYEALEKSEKSSIKAEAMYYKALNLRTQKKYTESNELIFKMASNYGNEGDWTPKALLIMTDNYISLKDLYQANYTLDMLIENYKDYPELVKKAQEKKKMIK